MAPMTSRLVCLALLLVLGAHAAAAQFALPEDAPGFTVTTFAEGLNFPIGMVELDDGSVLVALSNGDSFYAASSGRLVRLVDADDDGQAEVMQTLVETVPGASPTALARAGELVFVTGQGQPIVIYRLGDTPDAPPTQLGQITFDYGGAWQHKHSALLARTAPDDAGTVELYFQIGSAVNFEATTQTVAVTSDFDLAGTLAGDALHRLRLTDEDGVLTPVVLDQIASGLRNASGLAFHPETGDLYIADNGIDGLKNVNESFSADEVNVIAAADLGGAIEDFGFPSTYVAYRTGEVVGSQGIAPLVVFQPIPDPMTGAESEGPNDIAFAPAAFSEGLGSELFVGFHGLFSTGGLENEENPLVAVNLDGGGYTHFVGVDEAGVGHLDGLLTRGTDLLVADLSTDGRLSGQGANTGAIYRIRYEGVTDAAEGSAEEESILFTAYPNPFRETALLALTVPTPQRVRVAVYDVLGREIAVLHEGPVRARAPLELQVGEGLARGIYFAQAIGDAFRVTRRVVRVR